MDNKADEPKQPEDGIGTAPPKFMRTVQGWMIGLGGILAAALALKTAVLPLISGNNSSPDQQAQSVAKPLAVEAAPSPPPAPTEDLLPTSYEIPGGSLSAKGKTWTEVNNESVKKFREVSRNANGMTLISDESSYLRFPNDGGEVKMTYKDKVDWFVIYTATPTED